MTQAPGAGAPESRPDPGWPAVSIACVGVSVARVVLDVVPGADPTPGLALDVRRIAAESADPGV